MSRLFQLKPKTLELVSKTTRQEGVEPGTFKVASTNEKFKELRAVILFKPLEKREKYRSRKFWHLFIVSRETQRPYYFNIKGSSVKPFEDAMQNIADLFQMILQNTKAENRRIAAANAQLASGVEPTPLKALPQSVGDIIWRTSFTMYAWNRNGGPWMVGFKDFTVMNEEDLKDFDNIIKEINARRQKVS